MDMRGKASLHGECSGGKNSRLYTCWLGMKKRSKLRIAKGQDCPVASEWLDFNIFRAWSITTGYNDSKVLSRKGDVGGYTPTNANWLTDEQNQEEANETNKVTYKDYLLHGEPIEFRGMLDYCKASELNPSHMAALRNGKRKTHKGHTYRRPTCN